jgi:hypothetical protein
MKGLRIKGTVEPWDGKVSLLAVAVWFLPFLVMLIGTTERLVEERALRLEAERIMVEEVSELRERLDSLRDFMSMKEIDLAYERARMEESFFGGKRDRGDGNIEAVDDDDDGE